MLTKEDLKMVKKFIEMSSSTNINDLSLDECMSIISPLPTIDSADSSEEL